MFHVPQFKYNILSVSKLTKELQCSTICFPDFCVFQELFTGKVKGIGKKDGGFYLLYTNKTVRDKVVALTARGNETTEADKSDVVLWHRRCCHVYTQILKKLLLKDYETLKNRINKCTVCPSAKHAKMPFPTSSIQSSRCFDLIHVGL